MAPPKTLAGQLVPTSVGHQELDKLFVPFMFPHEWVYGILGRGRHTQLVSEIIKPLQNFVPETPLFG
jgi:hypothetical protein